MKGYAFANKEGKVFLVRCFKCFRENYMMAVASGKCVWCGAAPKKKDIEHDK